MNHPRWLFNGNDTSSYLSSIRENMKCEIQTIPDEQITSCDIDEWAKYYESKYQINQLVLYEENIDHSIKETSIQKPNEFRMFSPYEPEYFSVDGYSISFIVPYDGDSVLFDLKPTTHILTNFEVSDFSKPTDEKPGSFVITLDFEKEALKSHSEDMSAFVKDQFENKFRKYKSMIDYVNIDVDSYNSTLRSIALEELQKRKQKAIDFSFVSQKLQIPMYKRKNAPNTSPIPLKRIARTPIAKPSAKKASVEYSISDDDYTNIINIIHSACSSMEVTAKTFIKHDEEELRDFILATLSTHYENSVTGETFRKSGKTDILVTFDNKAAFVGECKIWHGLKPFSDAINQLFSYSTWKDTKTALIVFNKHNKDFNAIRRNVESWIKDSTKRYTLINGNTWECIIHRDDKNTDVRVAIALYDISC